MADDNPTNKIMKYTDDTVKSIVNNLRSGNTQRDSALLAGISESTFYEWMKYPEFSESIKRAEKECKARNIAIIQQAATKSWQAAAWYLERRYNDEYALKQINEHQGKDGKPIAINVTAYGHNDPLSIYANTPDEGSLERPPSLSSPKLASESPQDNPGC
jgi:hypothetical protein